MIWFIDSYASCGYKTAINSFIYWQKYTSDKKIMKNTYFLKENKQNSMQIRYANESISQHLTNPNKSDFAQTICTKYI